MSPRLLSSQLLFTTTPDPDFQTLRVGSLPYSILYLLILCTTKNISPLTSSLSTNTSFHESNVLSFASDDTSASLTFAYTIVYTSHYVLELNLSFSESLFSWLIGVLFQDTLSFTHVCSPHPSENLTLYGLFVVIPFYLTILCFIQIWVLVLHIVPLRTTKHSSHILFPHIVPPTIPSSLTHQCISNCFNLQPLPFKDQWNCAYQADPDTK